METLRQSIHDEQGIFLDIVQFLYCSMFQVAGVFMNKPTDLKTVKFDFAAIKKQYNEHASRCRQIAEEVSKWGRKKPQTLKFLANNR